MRRDHTAGDSPQSVAARTVTDAVDNWDARDGALAARVLVALEPAAFRELVGLATAPPPSRQRALPLEPLRQPATSDTRAREAPRTSGATHNP
jgi:hypothetical protein